jgi:hypothetical protein
MKKAYLKLKGFFILVVLVPPLVIIYSMVQTWTKIKSSKKDKYWKTPYKEWE